MTDKFTEGMSALEAETWNSEVTGNVSVANDWFNKESTWAATKTDLETYIGGVKTAVGTLGTTLTNKSYSQKIKD
jgi:hypothetical protein